MSDDEISDELLCPICKDYNVQPRLYDCGHSICEKCMVKKDDIDKRKVVNVFTIDYYACPICRNYTMKPWYLRPINRSLIDLLSIDDGYKEAHNAYTDDGHSEYDRMIYNPPDDMDLSRLAEDSRIAIANNIYNDIIPILFEAASKGKAFITIPTPLARDVRMVGDLVSKRLFQKHNIYKMVCSFRECTIELIKSQEGDGIRNEYQNGEYVNPRIYAIENSESPPNT